MARHFVAFDLGAGSGRSILGSLDQDKLELRELNRFPNRPLSLLGHLHWNVGQLFENLLAGLRLCASQATAEPESMAVDTWGVDFGLLAKDGSLLGLPYAYRDPRTDGTMEGFFRRIPREQVYDLTGIQFMQINSLFQLYAMVRNESPLLKVVDSLLFTPDLFNYLFTGIRATEFSIATTSQLYNPVARNWEKELFSALGLPMDIMQPVSQPGTILGNLDSAICESTGISRLPVVLCGSHDTASAVAAVPARGQNWAFLSSGTWSLMGIEVPGPIITPEARESNFTNEGGVDGTFRFLKNITGLWLVQQLKAAWAKEREYSFAELTQMAAEAEAFRSLVDPNNPVFMNPPDMASAMQQYCRNSRQPVPETKGALARCALESLALTYRQVLEQLNRVSPHPIEKIHMVGGGIQNQLLCQFAANATALPVIAGPVEATAAGNVLMQAQAKGHLAGLREIRECVRNSFDLKEYVPAQIPEWERAYSRFREMLDAKTTGLR